MESGGEHGRPRFLLIDASHPRMHLSPQDGGLRGISDCNDANELAELDPGSPSGSASGTRVLVIGRLDAVRRPMAAP